MISDELRLALVQTPLYWENPVANRAMLEEKLANIDTPVDLIILPEMFSTGFTMHTEKVAEVMGTHTLRWMLHQAASLQAAVTGSYVVKEKGKIYNRLIFAFPDGSYRHYDKKHLFRMAEEHRHYDAGTSRLIVEWRGWKIAPFVCYDLRFPAWSRNLYHRDSGSLDYDLLIYVANWPAPRSTAWDLLLRARAIENHSYCAGVNRIGEDGNGVGYSGLSSVAGPRGEWMATAGGDEKILRLTLSKKELQAYREKFPAYLDSDN